MLSFKWYENKNNSEENNKNLKNNEDKTTDSKTAEINDTLKSSQNNSEIGSFVCRNITVVHFPLLEIRKSDALGVQNEIIKRIENKRNDNITESSEKEDCNEVSKDICETAIYCICRRGFDSTLSTQLLLEMGFSNVINVSGGIAAWSASVDTLFPAY